MPSNDTNHSPQDTESTPVDVFALIAHEIRAEIIWVLGDPDAGGEMSFGELRSQLNIEVEPSQLHYHLQQLVGHFVTKTADGYRLNGDGIRLCLTLRAGTFDPQMEPLSIDADFTCYDCQAPVKAVFNPIGVDIICSDCERYYTSEFLYISPSAFKDEAKTFSFSHFCKFYIIKNFSMARGVCPICANPLKPTFESHEECYCARKLEIHQSCDLCDVTWTLSVGQALLADQELISFCFDHGVDVHSTPHWELDFAATDEHVTVRSTDPWEVALAVMFDGDTLELVIDGGLNVVERNRLDATTDTSASLLDHIQDDATFRDTRQDRDEVVLPDEAACLQSIRSHRWPEAVTCPRCDSADTTKEGWTSRGAQRYQCHDCDSTFNDLTETFFAEHRLSLSEMFHIIWEMDETATAEIARHLDRSSQSVLNFIREVEDARDEDSERHR